jgi:hypothetical protein
MLYVYYVTAWSLAKGEKKGKHFVGGGWECDRYIVSQVTEAAMALSKGDKKGKHFRRDVFSI